MGSEVPLHILLVSFPAQGHINPLLRLGKCLAAKGASVIFTTTEKAGKDMRITNKLATPIGDGCLTFEFFDHCLLDDAFEHDIPSALSWNNSSAVFATYYNYVHKLVPFPSETEPYIDVHLPFIVLKYNEIPDLTHPFNPYPILGTLITSHMNNLSKIFCVLADTYEELEHDFIDYLSKKSVLIRPIGPLFKNPTIKAASNIRGDFVKSDDDCSIIEWLHTKPTGKVVKWSPQEEVLDHPSVACFVTHCGWNSTMEAIASGVPVLAFPAFGDHLTNAKFLIDVFGVGIRLGYSLMENKLVTRDEVKKCLLEATTGEKAEELKKNAMKWKKEAEEAVAVGGSSDWNLDAFMEDIKKRGVVNIHKV
ncbi:UDP-glucosyltransferase family protein [Medicago truncatula]|uniref:UDP-glucosyltransferase family protein n=1 Tax=Medicago truncatula TaxID=3880 RepID=A0A072W1C0_MEDTR|nr:UDP-glucosyltransferase family protein [Medicago truncatula]